jgi:5-methylcytosine-specific restriction endonuclease McrA
MIKAVRTPCPPALDLTDPGSAGSRELAKVKAKLAAGEVLKSDDFSAYGNRAVREALREMFHGKCAYCESKIAGSQDTDVEHYRPKKGVTEADEAGVAHPGYWWLAMRWENLVLSCQHCNQSRSYHVIIPDGLETEDDLRAFLEQQPKTRAGKLNAFPVEGNAWVTDEGGDLATEKPLILNPVDMDPDDHLEWVLFQGASTVRAKGGSAVGEATRKILGLNRRWLEEDRRIRLLEMRRLRNRLIAKLNKWLEADSPVLAEVYQEAAQEVIDDLRAMTDEKQPFAGMARAFLSQVQDEVATMQS